MTADKNKRILSVMQGPCHTSELHRWTDGHFLWGQNNARTVARGSKTPQKTRKRSFGEMNIWNPEATHTLSCSRGGVPTGELENILSPKQWMVSSNSQ